MSTAEDSTLQMRQIHSVKDAETISSKEKKSKRGGGVFQDMKRRLQRGLLSKQQLHQPPPQMYLPPQYQQQGQPQYQGQGPNNPNLIDRFSDGFNRIFRNSKPTTTEEATDLANSSTEEAATEEAATEEAATDEAKALAN